MRKKWAPFIEVFKKRPFVTFAYLYGSRAKGNTNDRSDWDLAVYLKEPRKNYGPWPAFELEAEMSRAIGAEVQVTILNEPLSPLLGFEIVKHGIVVIDRDEGLRMDFENKILRNYHDWQYLSKRHIAFERHEKLF
jgi:predicted nucleotidyltransferase